MLVEVGFLFVVVGNLIILYKKFDIFLLYYNDLIEFLDKLNLIFIYCWVFQG